MERKLHVARNCGLPRFGGADPTRKDRVWWAGFEPLNPQQPLGPTRTLHVLTECPKSFITDESNAVLEVFALHRRTRALPETGGLFDQSAVLMDAFSTISNELTKVEAELNREKQRQDAHRPRRS